MKKILYLLLTGLIGLSTGYELAAQGVSALPKQGIAVDSVHIRDPFLLVDSVNGVYYMFGTTRGVDNQNWIGDGFDQYISRDMRRWQGPYPVFEPGPGFWGKGNFWAAECHEYRGKYYLFATIRGAVDSLLGTAIFVSDTPRGPFEEHSAGRVTPDTWQSLDGTLYVDEKGNPWMVFCHEWTQIGDGTMEAVRLTRDLKAAKGKPRTLFAASSAPWTVMIDPSKQAYVTDGPFLYRNRKGELLLLWSSFGKEGYAIGVARSQSGRITGPWEHFSEPLFARDGGHGMLFRTLDGELLLSIHQPNVLPAERPHFFRVKEATDGSLYLDGEFRP